MPKFSIAFAAPDEKNQLRHRLVEGADEESALKEFFNQEAQDFYSGDEQGYYYFREDFYDKTAKCGSIILDE